MFNYHPHFVWNLTFSFLTFVGISGKSQLLFAIVYTTRYLDLFTNFVSLYNSVMKVCIASWNDL